MTKLNPLLDKMRLKQGSTTSVVTEQSLVQSPQVPPVRKPKQEPSQKMVTYYCGHVGENRKCDDCLKKEAKRREEQKQDTTKRKKERREAEAKVRQQQEQDKSNLFRLPDGTLVIGLYNTVNTMWQTIMIPGSDEGKQLAANIQALVQRYAEQHPDTVDVAERTGIHWTIRDLGKRWGRKHLAGTAVGVPILPSGELPGTAATSAARADEVPK